MRKTFLATVLAAMSFSASAAPIGATGPNSFGYQGADIDYNLRDISSSGTEVLSSQDDGSSLQSILHLHNQRSQISDFCRDWPLPEHHD